MNLFLDLGESDIITGGEKNARGHDQGTTIKMLKTGLKKGME